MTTLEAFHQSDAPVYGFNGGSMKMHLTGAQTGGAFCMIESAMPAGAMTPRHVHDDEDEAFLVLEGALDITVSGKDDDDPQGRIGLRAARHPASASQPERPDRSLLRHFHASRVRRFRHGGGNARAKWRRLLGAPDPAKFAAIAARFGIRFLA